MLNVDLFQMWLRIWTAVQDPNNFYPVGCDPIKQSVAFNG